MGSEFRRNTAVSDYVGFTKEDAYVEGTSVVSLDDGFAEMRRPCRR